MVKKQVVEKHQIGGLPKSIRSYVTQYLLLHEYNNLRICNKNTYNNFINLYKVIKISRAHSISKLPSDLKFKLSEFLTIVEYVNLTNVSNTIFRLFPNINVRTFFFKHRLFQQPAANYQMRCITDARPSVQNARIYINTVLRNMKTSVLTFLEREQTFIDECQLDFGDFEVTAWCPSGVDFGIITDIHLFQDYIDNICEFPLDTDNVNCPNDGFLILHRDTNDNLSYINIHDQKVGYYIAESFILNDNTLDRILYQFLTFYRNENRMHEYESFRIKLYKIFSKSAHNTREVLLDTKIIKYSTFNNSNSRVTLSGIRGRMPKYSVF